MKIMLPNGEKTYLEDGISLEQKKLIVQDMLVRFECEITKNWNSNTIRFFLDGLGNYLVWHKEPEDKGHEDKEVLSVTKVKRMSGKDKPKELPFTYLTMENKYKLFGEVEDNE